MSEESALVSWFNERRGKTLKLNDRGINVVISALEKQINGGWVKCSDELPKYTDDYNVTVGIGSILGYFEEVRTYRYEIFNGKNPYQKWIIPNNFNEIVNVIAWKNLPTPYQESEVL